MTFSSLLYETDNRICDETTFNLSGFTLGDYGGSTGKCPVFFSTVFVASFFIYQSHGTLLRASLWGSQRQSVLLCLPEQSWCLSWSSWSDCCLVYTLASWCWAVKFLFKPFPGSDCAGSWVRRLRQVRQVNLGRKKGSESWVLVLMKCATIVSLLKLSKLQFLHV